MFVLPVYNICLYCSVVIDGVVGVIALLVVFALVDWHFE